MVAALHLTSGALYAGVYEIGERLGSGGTGTVYRARHVVLEQERALKVLHPRDSDAGHRLGQLRLEASVFGRLKGEPTLVMPYDLGFDEATSTHFIAMELLEGCDLASWVYARGPLDVETTLRVMRQVARGLDAAHRYVNAQGRRTPIVHRDLSPSNIFLQHAGAAAPRVKILDFGLADMVDEARPTQGSACGTPLYRAYEQATGAEVTPQTDVWAFALVTYFALTGQPYWTSGSAVELHEEITSRPFEAPSERLRRQFVEVRLPAAFDEWLLRCLNRLPRRRFTTVGEAIDELQWCFEGSQGDTVGVVVSGPFTPSPWLEPSVRHVGRSRTLARAASRTASQTASRTALRDEPHRELEHPDAVAWSYVVDVHSALKEVVRLGDDLMTATGHYLAFAPESVPALRLQLQGVAQAVALYNAASERMRGSLGDGAFREGIERARLHHSHVAITSAIHAAFSLPERLLAPRDAHEPGDTADAADVLAAYCAHSTHWQMERVRLQARIEVAKRTLLETERSLETFAFASHDTLSHWTQRAEAAVSAAELISRYEQRMSEFSAATSEWVQLLERLGNDYRFQPPGELANAEELSRGAWRLAEPIEAMNTAYVALEARALELKVLLRSQADSGPAAATASTLAQQLTDIIAFQWYEVRPQLNGLLVNIIRLLCTNDAQRVQGLLADDRSGWVRLQALATRTVFGARASARAALD